jgi:hypothetical protein
MTGPTQEGRCTVNPILSDLDIRISTIEAEAGLAARQRRHLAQGSPAPRSGLASSLLSAVRQFLDPRGYALAVVDARDRARLATRPVRIAAPVRSSVTVLPSRQPGQDAELPVAA